MIFKNKEKIFIEKGKGYWQQEDALGGIISEKYINSKEFRLTYLIIYIINQR